MANKIPSQDNPIIDKTFNFAVCILKYSQDLQDQKQYVLARQLQRCGTSIGANTREMPKAKRISSISSKLLLKKPMRRNIGYYYVMR
jgi:hypothetical protein